MTHSEGSSRLAFTVDARIIAQLGEQLVPTDLMALAELVKNSYDADATIVTVDYDESDGKPTLIIEDDGNGMDLETLRDGWMHIGTALKEKDPLSPRFGRPRAGVKGVGRFAAQRLGDRLHLETVRRGSSVVYSVDFDWSEFKAGTALNSITHEIHEEPVTRETPGTRLSITGLRKRWSIEDLTDLVKDLIRLHNPRTTKAREPGFESEPGFEVVAGFHSEGIHETIDELSLLRDERLLHLHGEVDEHGKGYFRLEFFRPERPPKTISYSGELSMGPLALDVDLVRFNSKWLTELAARRAQAIGRKHGGLRVWRDGFRVFPYGRPGDDWLGIDEHIAARRLPLNMWRNQGILGGIHISRETNPELQDLLTRKGMIESEAYEDLRKFVFEGLVIAATEHAAVSGQKTRSGPRKPIPSEALREVLESFQEPSSIEEVPEGGSPGDEDPEAGRKTTLVETVKNQLIASVEAAERPLLDENAMLKVLASLGTGLAVFAHEMKTVSLPIAVSAKKLEELVLRSPEELRAPLESVIHGLRDGINALGTFSRYIEDFVSESSRTRRSTIELAPFFEEFFKTFSSLLDRKNIKLRLDVPRGLRTRPVFKAEWISIFFNLMTNSIKALLAPGTHERRMLVQARRDGGNLVIIFADSGCGIPGDIKGEIFEPYVTRSHEAGDPALGRGTGLGLFVLREMLESYDGTIGLIEAPQGFVTAFEIHIPSKGGDL